MLNALLGIVVVEHAVHAMILWHAHLLKYVHSIPMCYWNICMRKTLLWKILTCGATCNAETEAWFIDSFEAWRRSKNLSNFVLLGHSFGGYVAAKYALKVIAFPS